MRAIDCFFFFLMLWFFCSLKTSLTKWKPDFDSAASEYAKAGNDWGCGGRSSTSGYTHTDFYYSVEYKRVTTHKGTRLFLVLCNVLLLKNTATVAPLHIRGFLTYEARWGTFWGIHGRPWSGQEGKIPLKYSTPQDYQMGKSFRFIWQFSVDMDRKQGKNVPIGPDFGNMCNSV